MAQILLHWFEFFQFIFEFPTFILMLPFAFQGLRICYHLRSHSHHLNHRSQSKDGDWLPVSQIDPLLLNRNGLERSQGSCPGRWSTLAWPLRLTTGFCLELKWGIDPCEEMKDSSDRDTLSILFEIVHHLSCLITSSLEIRCLSV